MEKIYKILGKRGRITIPYELRLKHGFAYNDVVSFEETDKDTIVTSGMMTSLGILHSKRLSATLTP